METLISRLSEARPSSPAASSASIAITAMFLWPACLGATATFSFFLFFSFYFSYSISFSFSYSISFSFLTSQIKKNV
jgi:hypothetical protein